jgi:acyl-CoA dehydrogenase
VAIDFTFPDEVEDARLLVRKFMRDTVGPKMAELRANKAKREEWGTVIRGLRNAAKEQGLWCPHMPEEFGGMGLGHTAVAAMAAEAVKTPRGPYLINCQAPDEGNMHTLLHFGTEDQKEKWLRPLCDGTMRSCFSMTEPEVAGSDPTQIQTSAVQDGDEWVINGHKWFTSGAHGADFAIVIARTDPDAEIAQARNSAFIVPLSSPGFEIVRDVQTMGGGGGIRKCATRTCACRRTTCSASAAPATNSAKSGWDRRGSRIACAGSARSNRRSRCSSIARKSASRTGRCCPRSRASNG